MSQGLARYIKARAGALGASSAIKTTTRPLRPAVIHADMIGTVYFASLAGSPLWQTRARPKRMRKAFDAAPSISMYRLADVER